MLIADAQVHIWAADTPERPWRAVRNQPHRPVPFSRTDLIAEMDAAGVARAVIVPPSWEGDRNDLALQAATLHPGRIGVMGRIAADQPATSAPLLENWHAQPGMLGLRFTSAIAPGVPGLSDGSMDWIWPLAERFALPVMLACPGELAAVGRIAEAHPGLRLIVDHLALPRGAKDAAAFVDIPQLVALAKHPNVAAKASALPCVSTEPYPYRNTHEPLHRVFDAFGPQRMFWGTDITRLPCTYRQAISMFTEELPFLTGADQEWVMGRGLCRFLRWEASA
jgi:L-fuconolactonase